MNYFRTIGGKLIFAGVIALETVFAAGIWFMISVGLFPALGDWSSGLAFIVAPVEAVQRDVDYIRDVTEAYNELDELKDEQEARKQARKVKAPATARYRISAPQSRTRPLADPHLDTQAEQVSMNQNGQTSK